MPDIVTTIQSAIEIVGKLRALSKKIEDAEFKMLLADLSGELADAKLEVANLKMELAEVKERLREKAEELAQRDADKPTLSEGAYQFSGDSGFFCTACFDTMRRRVRVTNLPAPFEDMGKWQCPSCKAVLGASKL
jgi:hypothetical protein